MTADAAARAIRESDPSGSIGIVSDDPHPPYNRPPLSKGLWKGDDPEKVWRGTDKIGVELRLARHATAVNTKRNLSPMIAATSSRTKAVACHRRHAPPAPHADRSDHLLPHL